MNVSRNTDLRLIQGRKVVPPGGHGIFWGDFAVNNPFFYQASQSRRNDFFRQGQFEEVFLQYCFRQANMTLPSGFPEQMTDDSSGAHFGIRQNAKLGCHGVGCFET